MATVKSTLALNDKMTSTFTSITKAMRSTLNAMQSVNSNTEKTAKIFARAEQDINKAEQALKNYGKNLDNVNNKNKKTSTSSGSLIKSILGASAVQKVFGMITGQLDNAIDRLDTLNNFPKVMSNLGIDEAASQTAIDTLSEKLKGIPTTLDSAAAAVQRFTSSNGNVQASTEMFLALNNAILAGGASTEIQASALEQISQSYAKGKPDMMEWRALISAMPAQLNQVAKVMGYVSADKLGESLRNGKVSMNEFMQTLIKMNKEGVEGFKSFEEQARNSTNGIKTSIANMKSAITRGLGSIIKSINKGLEKTNLPNISQLINGFGKSIENMLKKVGSVIQKALILLQPVFNIIKQIYNFIKSNWSWIGPIILGIVSALIIYNTYTLLAALGSKLLANALQIITIKGMMTAIAIGIIAGLLIYLWDTNDTVAYWMLYAWDALQLGLDALKVGAQVCFYAIIISALTMYNGFLGVKLGLQTAMNGLVLAGQTLALGFEGVCQGIVNGFIWMYNKVVELLNKLGAHFNTMNYADFTSKTVKGISQTMKDYADEASKTYGQMNDTSNKISEYSNKLNEAAYSGATKIQNKVQEFQNTRQQRTNDRKNLGSVGNAVSNASKQVTDAMNNSLNNITGTDNSGGKAVKTTTKDNLLSDEDIQLLLDVATRDYKLNYQQITPNITLTFGDIRETADVDGVLDAVADKLEEIYDTNLEVSK